MNRDAFLIYLKDLQGFESPENLWIPPLHGAKLTIMDR